MRFAAMHKLDKNSEAGIPPSQGLLEEMGRFLLEGAAAGVFQSGEGLHSSSKRARLTCSAGHCTVVDGPFTGSNELIAAFAMLQVKSKEEAIHWAERLAAILGDVEIEVGQVKEPWDLGLGSKPENAAMRFLLLTKSDVNSEAGVSPTPALIPEIEKLTGEMRVAGVLLLAERLQPSSQGAKLIFSKGKRTVLDGPFTESKELIGGYSIIHVLSKGEAIAWATAFAKVLSDNVTDDIDIDVRAMA